MPKIEIYEKLIGQTIATYLLASHAPFVVEVANESAYRGGGIVLYYY